VEVITAMGVEAVTNCCVGKDITFPELREQHDAVIIAVGAKKSRDLPIPGADADGVIGGVEFLRDVSLGQPLTLGRGVVVIGGGNVAYDVGRTVVRQIAVDAARTARRAKGKHEVYLCSLESLEEMPADDIEIIEGDEEGVIRHNSLGPKEILKDDDGRVRGVLFQKCLRVFDEEHRFSPKFDESDTLELACETVLISVGQAADVGFIDAERDGLELLPNGAIKCDPENGETAQEDVFVSGDLAYGPKLLIHAVASGKAVARAIYKKVTDRTIGTEAVELHFADASYTREAGYEKTERLIPGTLPPGERLVSQSALVDAGFTQEQARLEASRCLNCGVNTIFDGDRCVLCGGCVDVCPEQCLKIVPLSAFQSGNGMQDAVERLLDGHPEGEASAIIKDETVCIRCALCAERCPVAAITMEDFHFKEKPICLAD
jgi:NADPH-dependent glutamate synthase beta subunit-like oxidoreductase